METGLIDYVGIYSKDIVKECWQNKGWKTKGWISEYRYKKYMDEQRRERPQNKMFSNLILTALKGKRKNLSWLAEQAGISIQHMCKCSKGIYFTNMDAIDKIWQALDLDYNTLDYILGD